MMLEKKSLSLKEMLPYVWVRTTDVRLRIRNRKPLHGNDLHIIPKPMAWIKACDLPLYYPVNSFLFFLFLE